ncbi:RNA 2',3'-cyclic phosphodiesterase [Bacteroidota bacterium]
MKRTFIAIKLPVTEQTSELVNDIKSNLNDEKIKWVDNWNLHITLFFLGDTEEEIINKIGNTLTDYLKDIKSFTLSVKGLGIFKNIHNPRIIWLGINESDDLKKLKRHLDKTLESFGFYTEDKEFKPHLTIGRIKFLKNKKNLNNLLNKYKEQEFQNFIIKEVIFYESRLTSEGPVYRSLKTFPLS